MDQGREFINHLSDELYSITNTEHRITTAYHPQVNSLLNLMCSYTSIIYIALLLYLS